MNLIIFLLAATSIAVFATIGYIQGARWAFISLLILFGTLLITDLFEDQIVMAMNGIYTGIMLLLNGGLGAIASGDFDAVSETISTIEKPFEGESAKYAILLVIAMAVGFTLILAAVMKSRKGVFGLIWGFVYGYLLAAAVIPLITVVPAGTLPFPILYPADLPSGDVQAATNQLWTRLSEPQTISAITILIGLFLVVFLLLTVRRGVKRGGGKKEKANGSS
ncbi:MAG: hypothetical protein R2844_07980 [Caldilineales bacterium]